MGVFDSNDQQMLTAAFETALGNYGFTKGGSGQQNFNPQPQNVPNQGSSQNTSGAGAGTGGAGGGFINSSNDPLGGGSSVGASGTDTAGAKKATGDLYAAALKAVDTTGELASDSIDIITKQAVALDNVFQGTIFDKIQYAYGMSVDAYKDLDNLDKIGNKFVRNEVDNALKLQTAYFDNGEAYSKFFKTSEDFLAQTHETQMNMTELNYRSLQSFDSDERGRVALFEKNMDIAGDKTAALLNRTYAYSGETSDKVLQDITAHAQHMSKVAGIGMKDLAGEMAAIMSDTETFGNMQADQAARLAATYKQLGLDLSTFSTLVKGYRDFDTAAQKMGDLSAMFGVQMDAMEMMYLANEDEEQFLHRFREQMLDQGVDVENMSKTRLRALGQQLNMSQEQLQTFFREGELVADQADQQQANAEAEQMGLKETQKIVESMKFPIQRTKEEYAKLFTGKQTADKIAELGKLRVASADLAKNITAASTAYTYKDLGIDKDPMGAMLDNTTALLEGANKKMSGKKGKLEMGKGMITLDGVKKDLSGLTGIYVDAAEDATQAHKDTVNKRVVPKSTPWIMEGWDKTRDWMANTLTADLKKAAKKAAEVQTDTVAEGVKKGTKKVEEASKEAQTSLLKGMDPEFVKSEMDKFYNGFVPDARVMAELQKTAEEMGVSVKEFQDPLLEAKKVMKEGGTIEEMVKAHMGSGGSIMELQNLFAQRPEMMSAMSGGASTKADLAKILGVDPSSEDVAAKLKLKELQSVTKIDPKTQAILDMAKKVDEAMAKNTQAMKEMQERPLVVNADISMDGNKVAKGVMKSDYMTNSVSNRA